MNELRSTVAIKGHPIHPLLVTIPISPEMPASVSFEMPGFISSPI